MSSKQVTYTLIHHHHISLSKHTSLLHTHTLAQRNEKQNKTEAEFLDVTGTKVLSFPPCHSRSPVLTDFTPPLPLSKSGLKLDSFGL
jgi:hypothetical protein